MDEILKRMKEQKIHKIAIMGGTFDPIHYGHLVAAETVRVAYNFDKILFIPSGLPPHKNDLLVTDDEHRYIMVQIATMSNPHFEVSRIEMDRKGSSYTIDTIKEIIRVLGSGVDIYFITGADAILEILTWKNPEELLSLCKIIAVTRPGYNREQLDNKVKELEGLYNANIITMDIPALAISSTEIRKIVSSCGSIKYLVPEGVEEYIIKKRLYISE